MVDPKAVNFNGNLVPDEPSEVGYGEWMIVTRRNQTKNRPNGPPQNGINRVHRPKPQSTVKPGPNGSQKERVDGPSNLETARSKGPMAQASWPTYCANEAHKNKPKNVVGKPKPSSHSSTKDKASQPQLEHVYDQNPLLKKHSSANQPILPLAQLTPFKW